MHDLGLKDKLVLRLGVRMFEKVILWKNLSYGQGSLSFAKSRLVVSEANLFCGVPARIMAGQPHFLLNSVQARTVPTKTKAKTAFIIFAILCFGGVFASLSRGRVR
jgi:hypothetical protein